MALKLGILTPPEEELYFIIDNLLKGNLENDIIKTLFGFPYFTSGNVCILILPKNTRNKSLKKLI